MVNFVASELTFRPPHSRAQVDHEIEAFAQEKHFTDALEYKWNEFGFSYYTTFFFVPYLVAVCCFTCVATNLNVPSFWLTLCKVVYCCGFTAFGGPSSPKPASRSLQRALLIATSQSWLRMAHSLSLQ